ncbi:DUF4157 domain-containing protein [Spirosoma sp. BT702]|uniref:DUF4157 domain-containing protein n=1 Tax=Spirosoma profusum TaxID=2771354 RepID=A0A926XVP1_9BACT|nr:DUF4157 domain-containing protein [Spirosoma profusum]MBD2700765.1 DUF4157 domain-containing protein [Spirosoma profusum]
MKNRVLHKPEPVHTNVPFIAAKSALTVSQPGDASEREADAVAERVTGDSTADVLPSATFVPPAIQRKCAECEEEEKTVQRQEQSTATSPSGTYALKSQLDNQAGQGSVLPGGTRQQMEGAFGTDFGGVRVHIDNQAVMLSRQLNAHAFTYGKDIYFDDGRFDTSSSGGQKLLAHELTHVVQQSGAVQRQIQRQEAPQDTTVPPPTELYEMTDEDWEEAFREQQELIDFVLESFRRPGRADSVTFLSRLRGLSASQATQLAYSDTFFNEIGRTFRGRSLWTVFSILFFNNRQNEPYTRLSMAMFMGDARLVVDLLSMIVLQQTDARFYEMLRRALAHEFNGNALLPEMLRLIDHRSDVGISQRHDATYDEVHYEKNAAGNYALSTMTGTISANSYISGNDLRVIVRIRFMDGNSGQGFYFLGDNTDVYDRWQRAMTNAWNNKFAATNGVNTLNVVFVPLFLSEPDPQAMSIRVMTDKTQRCSPSTEPGRSEQTCWFLNVSDRTVAHEFGHILGASDEYNLPGSYQEVRNAGITLSPEDMMASTVEGIRGAARPAIGARGGYDVPSLMGSGSTVVETRHLSRLMRLINAGLPAGTPPFQLRSRS